MHDKLFEAALGIAPPWFVTGVRPPGLEQAPVLLLEQRLMALTDHSARLVGAHLVECLVELGHHVEAVEVVQRPRAVPGDDLEVRAPHVRADVFDRAGQPLADEGEERLEALFGSVLADPQQPHAVSLDLVDQRQGLAAAADVNPVDADGAYRPAYNVQYASDCASQMVVGVEVCTLGSDMAQLAPMVEQVEQRVNRVPDQWLVDGGFPAHPRRGGRQDRSAVQRAASDQIDLKI